MKSTQLNYILALNSIRGVSSNTLIEFKKKFSSFESVFSAKGDELQSIKGIGPVTAESILNMDVEKFIEVEEKLIRDEGVRIVSIDDENYPDALRALPDPPFVLYVKGVLKKDNIVSLSVVGSRKPTNYGKITVEKLVTKMVKSGFTIISGMARGIDSLAHKSTISSGGETIAVLGCGLSVTYPPENKRLKDEIVSSGGAVISEFSMMERPEKMNFPQRNRIISGLSPGTLVIEAAAKSGSLITADFALEQGKEVFAVPGNISSSLSSGCNKLIKSGAKLVEDIEDIIDELPDYIKKEVEVYKTKNFSVTCKNIGLTQTEKSILSLLSDKERHVDELIENLKLTPSNLLNILSRLELLGAVKQHSGKMFVSAIDFK